eukprot:366573-Chlamydomonas_euryale.AAC.42
MTSLGSGASKISSTNVLRRRWSAGGYPSCRPSHVRGWSKRQAALEMSSCKGNTRRGVMDRKAGRWMNGRKDGQAGDARAGGARTHGQSLDRSTESGQINRVWTDQQSLDRSTESRQINRWMDGRTGGQVRGWTGGWTDAQVDGRVDERINGKNQNRKP